MKDECEEFFGKYRGTVENPVDLEGLGRVQVSVPDVLGDGKFAWAMPCVPFAGKTKGFFAVPPKHAHVWVEFERGDPDYPIWSGCYWLKGEPPDPTGGVQQIAKTILQTDTVKIVINDAPTKPDDASLSLEVPALKAKLSVGASGLTIQWGTNTIQLAVDGVSINKSNLKVMP